ncbi:hypothetical protein AB0K52_22375 [Glycomyces sp. NPDC049804]|uniref:hypothetical protein n=1 Tax=Glycomyces sp. NPDC049804 TaxID=3154363 RepID=UPI003430CE5B
MIRVETDLIWSDATTATAAHPEIGWAAVRATPKGRRSALAALPTAIERSD